MRGRNFKKFTTWIKRHQKISIFLTLILVVTIFLRVVDLSNTPKSIYGDGLTLVYDAYSILKTGQDQEGNFLPLLFPLGGSRPPAYVYATIPFVVLFGPTDLAARSVSILSGIGFVLLMFFLGKTLLDENLGLIAAIIAAISPWDLSLSRGPFESHFALFLSLLGLLAFMKGKLGKKWYLLSACSFSLAMFTYSTYLLTVPLLITFMLILYRKKIKKYFQLNKLWAIFSISLVIFSLFLNIWLMTGRGNNDRFSNINILKQSDTYSKIQRTVINDRNLDGAPRVISLGFHNSIIGYSSLIAENYIRNFTPSFLFLHGDFNPRHNPAEIGELYWMNALLIVAGLMFLCRNNLKILALLMGWILISPLATALVGEPHALRSSFLLVPLILLSAYGFLAIWGKRATMISKISLVIIGLFLIIQLPFFVDQFYFLSPNKDVSFWSYSAKQASEIAVRNYRKYDYIILSTNIPDIEYAFPVYTRLDPNTVITQNKNINQSKKNMGEYHFHQYNNVYIGEIPRARLRSFLAGLPGSVLYVGSIEDKNYIDGYLIDINADHVPDLVIYTRLK